MTDNRKGKDRRKGKARRKGGRRRPPTWWEGILIVTSVIQAVHVWAW